MTNGGLRLTQMTMASGRGWSTTGVTGAAETPRTPAAASTIPRTARHPRGCERDNVEEDIRRSRRRSMGFPQVIMRCAWKHKPRRLIEKCPKSRELQGGGAMIVSLAPGVPTATRNSRNRPLSACAFPLLPGCSPARPAGAAAGRVRAAGARPPAQEPCVPPAHCSFLPAVRAALAVSSSPQSAAINFSSLFCLRPPPPLTAEAARCCCRQTCAFASVLCCTDECCCCLFLLLAPAPCSPLLRRPASCC